MSKVEVTRKIIICPTCNGKGKNFELFTLSWVLLDPYETCRACGGEGRIITTESRIVSESKSQ